jgi:hypothetical protein
LNKFQPYSDNSVEPDVLENADLSHQARFFSGVPSDKTAEPSDK